MPEKTRFAKDGSTRDGATADRAILEDERVWRQRHCPGATVALQRLTARDDKYFDVVTLWTTDGPRVVWFDVSNSFGKRLEEAQKILKSLKRLIREAGKKPAARN